jgi:DUF1365 family protein
MRSHLYQGQVWHMRTQPRYFFSYGAFYLSLDLREIDEVDARLKLFSRNRLNLLSFRDADYLASHNDDIAEGAAGLLRLAGFSPDNGSLSLITHPRVLDYAFNPVSFFLHRDVNGAVRYVIAEVHNTWGERHLYDLPAVGQGGSYRSQADKTFYVSPFMDVEGRYDFHLSEREGRLQIRLDEYRDLSNARPEALEGPHLAPAIARPEALEGLPRLTPREAPAFFRAGMDLRPLPLTDANIMRMLLRYPLVTFKTIGAIHWQGLKLWLRGERFRPHSSPASAKAGLVQ